MLFDGFAFSGYRSVGDELLKVAPLKKINLIIGPNNSGKSNIINFLYKHYHGLKTAINSQQPAKTPFSEMDHHQSSHPAKARVAFPINTQSDDFQEFLDTKTTGRPEEPQLQDFITALLTSPRCCDVNGFV